MLKSLSGSKSVQLIRGNFLRDFTNQGSNEQSCYCSGYSRLWERSSHRLQFQEDGQ